MASERIRRQIDALLDQAEGAISDGAWQAVAEKARAVLAIDPGNEDAIAFLAMAAANGAGAAPPEESPAADSPAPASSPAPSAQPDSFAGGRYAVRRFLGEGGKKKVYLAHDSLLDRDVAFALIKIEGLDATGRERITREAQAMGRLGSHPHIVSIFDIGEHSSPDGTSAPYVVTELMGGGDVEGLIEDAGGPLPLERTLEIATGVARGLAFAHERQVVHRDLKPGNVWLTADGVAKIGDFGLAVSLDRSRLTQHGMMVGTVAYMPPEQALGGTTTPQADLYSLGAMLYEMVTGRPPFTGSDSTSVISQHINTPPVAPSWHSEHCPPLLEELILRLLAKAPEDRPASAADVLAVLERVDPAERSASHSTSAANPLDRLARGVFVGRTGELERLRAAFDEAFAGRGSVVMLVGEPGIGKTRTTQELETYARMRGAYVFWGRTHESAGMPAYWPWVQVGNAWGGAVDLMASSGQPLLQGGALSSEASELARLFPALRTLPGFVEPEATAEPEAAQFRLFDAYATFMRNQSRERPWLVMLDDLHWADKPTLQLLQFVARELANMRVLVVGTYRDTDLVRTHPLSEVLAELNREGGFLRLSLRGLDRDEVADYIAQRAGVRPPREVADRIFDETEGNPFFLSEVVNLMAEEGTLTSDSVSDIALPEGVREALGRRLDRLSEEANELLQVCAISGRQFSYDTLTLLGERSDEVLLRLIEEALRARVIEETDTPGRYRFTHALMHETLLGELSTTRRVRLHGQVGEALEHRYGPSADTQAARLATHYAESATLTAAHRERAIHYSRLAGEQAELQYAWAEAARHYERCVALIEDEESPALPGLLHAHGRAAQGNADWRASWRSLMRALDIYRARGDRLEFARVALDARTVPAPPARARAIRDEALQEPDALPPELEARLLVGLPASLTDSALAERARELTRVADVPDVQARILLFDAHRAFVEGDHETTERLARDAVKTFDAAGLHGEAADNYQPVCRVYCYRGDLDGALRECSEYLARSERLHLRQPAGFAHQLRAAIRLIRCEFDEHELEWAQLPEENFLWDIYPAMRAEWAGGLPRAVELLPPREKTGGVAGFSAIVFGHRARILFNAGRIEEARDEFGRWWELVREAPLGTLPMGLAIDEALVALAPRDVVNKVYEHTAGASWSRFDVFAVRSIDRVRGAFAFHLDRLDDAEQHLITAVEWTTREGCPVELGRSLQGLTEIAELRGNREEAMAHLDRAGELFARHGAKLYLDQVLAKKEILKA